MTKARVGELWEGPSGALFSVDYAHKRSPEHDWTYFLGVRAVPVAMLQSQVRVTQTLHRSSEQEAMLYATRALFKYGLCESEKFFEHSGAKLRTRKEWERKHPKHVAVEHLELESLNKQGFMVRLYALEEDDAEKSWLDAYLDKNMRRPEAFSTEALARYGTEVAKTDTIAARCIYDLAALLLAPITYEEKWVDELKAFVFPRYSRSVGWREYMESASAELLAAFPWAAGCLELDAAYRKLATRFKPMNIAGAALLNELY